MIQITALLSWYDEHPEWLERCVLSLAKIPVDRIVALDGAYALYPGGYNRSHPAQEAVIRKAARKIGIRCEVRAPATVWKGNEVEKRNRLFEIAEQTTYQGDWYFVIDADEFVAEAPNDVKSRLEGAMRLGLDVGAVQQIDPGPLGPIEFPTHPKFFRAIRGLRAVGDHFTYTTPDGHKLWGDAKRERLEPRADLTKIVVEHHIHLRHPDRRRAQMGYYKSRDAEGVEELPKNRSVVAA